MNEIDKKRDVTGLIRMDFLVQSVFLAIAFYGGLSNNSSLQAVSFYFGLNTYQLVASLLDRGTITPLAYLKWYWIIEGCCVFFVLNAMTGSFGSAIFLTIIIPVANLYYYALTINNYVNIKK